MAVLKGFKVSGLSGIKFGVAASSLSDLIEKSSRKFNVSAGEVRLVLLDGTRLDEEEFFLTLSNQTELLLLLPGQNIDTSPGIIRLVGGLLKHWRGDQLLDGVRSLVKDLGVDLSAESGGEDKSTLSSCQDDPDWFKDLDTRARCKEQYLRERCAVRVRTFFYRSRRQTWQSCSDQDDSQQKPTPTERHILDATWRVMAEELRRNSAHGGYFDRGDERRMCDDSGVFRCAGAVECKDGCSFFSQHRINPYSNRHSRIQFSTWNLDHRIERSRSVLPALISACHLCHQRHLPSNAVNWRYFYSLLFTADNLALVHIVCHDKRAHSQRKCDPDQYLVSESSPLAAELEKPRRQRREVYSVVDEPAKRLKSLKTQNSTDVRMTRSHRQKSRTKAVG